MTTLPTVPVTVHLPKVCVVVPSAMVWATVLVDASSVNWLSPVIVRVDVPVVPPMVSLLYERKPPLKSRLVVPVSDKTMLAVPLYKFRFVIVDASQTAPVPDKVHVPEPSFKVLALLLENANNPVVTL